MEKVNLIDNYDADIQSMNRNLSKKVTSRGATVLNSMKRVLQSCDP